MRASFPSVIRRTSATSSSATPPPPQPQPPPPPPPQANATIVDAVTQYQRDGFAVLPSFVPRATVASLRADAADIMATFDPAQSRSVFSTKDQQRTSDEYFFGSANSVRCFFEEDAQWDASTGALLSPKHLAINKIGHALHTQRDVFKRFALARPVQAAAAAVARAMGFRGPPACVQTMYICKPPSIGGRVVAHQDNTFLFTEPLSTFALWFALEDASRANGCLWGLPGSHEPAEPVRRFVRSADDTVSFVPPKPAGAAADFPDDSDPRWVPLEMAAGSMVLLHGTVVHMSRENTNPTLSRHAFSMHFVDSAAHWSAGNWMRQPDRLVLAEDTWKK